MPAQSTTRPQPEAPEVTHVVWDNGREVLMHYRCDENALSRFLRWEYRPDWRAEWKPVQAPTIIRNLDNGVHPRTGECSSVMAIVERLSAVEYEYFSALEQNSRYEAVR